MEFRSWLNVSVVPYAMDSSVWWWLPLCLVVWESCACKWNQAIVYSNVRGAFNRVILARRFVSQVNMCRCVYVNVATAGLKTWFDWSMCWMDVFIPSGGPNGTIMGPLWAATVASMGQDVPIIFVNGGYNSDNVGWQLGCAHKACDAKTWTIGEEYNGFDVGYVICLVLCIKKCIPVHDDNIHERTLTYETFVFRILNMTTETLLA